MGIPIRVVGLTLITASFSLPLSACGGSSAGTSPRSAADYAQPGDGTSVGEVHKRGDKKLIAEVGPRGGTLELSNGARLTIPEGAFSETVEVTFAEGARTTAFSNHEYEKVIGPTLEISPETSPSTPLLVSLPLINLPEGFQTEHLTLGLEVPSDAQRLESQNVQTHWDYLPAQSESGRIVASMETVPGYRVQFLVSRND